MSSNSLEHMHTTAEFMLSLPTEIYLAIFHLLAEDDNLSQMFSPTPFLFGRDSDYQPSNLWSLTHVCSKFRRIAVSTPTLWSTFTVDLRAMSASTLEKNGSFYFHFYARKEWLRTYIERSGICPLTVRVYVGRTPYWQHSVTKTRFIEHCHPISQLLLSCAPRINTIRMWTDRLFTVDSISDFFTLSQFLGLQTLEWNHLDDGTQDSSVMVSKPGGLDAIRAFTTASSPQRLKIAVFGEQWVDLLKSGWRTTLTHLEVRTISQAPQTIKLLFDILSLLDKLEVLDIVFYEVKTQGPLLLITDRVQLPNLQSLSTGQQNARDGYRFFLKHVYAPKLTSMTLRDHLFATPVCVLEVCHLRELVLSFQWSQMGTIHNSAPDIRAFFASIPLLERLSLISRGRGTSRMTIHVIIRTLASDDQLCPVLSRTFISTREGNAANILQFLQMRNQLAHLEYTCWSLQGSESEIELLNQLSKGDRLHLSLRQ